jgi:archaellum biogenesis protein FlaJ (TadC family)
MKYKYLKSKKVSLATVLSILIILELLIYALINTYWESPARGGGLGEGLFLDGVIVLLSGVNMVLFLIYAARIALKKSKFTPIPLIVGLLCLWLGMLLFQ